VKVGKMFRNLSFFAFLLIFIPVLLYTFGTNDPFGWGALYTLLIVAMVIEAYFERRNK
jgi:hypothetical protein